MTYPNTFTCDLQYELIKTFKGRDIQTFAGAEGFGLPDIHGTMIPWSQLLLAKDGCEVQRMRGIDGHACHCPSYNQRFRIVDKTTQKPISGIKYKLVSESGTVVEGETGEDGLTEKVHGLAPEKVMLFLEN